MPIPFNDDESIEALGSAAFLQLICLSDEPQHWAGCLLFINARGEPLEFVYNRVELLPSVLWRPDSAALAATRRLVTSLLDATALTPALLFIPETVITGALFGADRTIWPAVPDIRVHQPAGSGGAGRDDAPQGPATVIWGSHLHDAKSARLYSLICERGLIFEPFARARLGLREVYPEWANMMAS